MLESPGGWKRDAISATHEWLRLLGGASSGEQRWKDLGEARAGTEPGWLVLDRRGSELRPESLNDLCFAANGGPDVAAPYPIETYRLDDEVLRLKEPDGLPATTRTVWTRSIDSRSLVEKLLVGLQAATPGSTPLADAFAQRRLATSVDDQLRTPPELVGAQRDAYRACLSPGARLVWGPPGTGKTRVLARAIEDLINTGKRVLLLSTANIAVDNALHAVITSMRPARGTVIRVGPPQLAEIANNPEVQPSHLARGASEQADQQGRAVEQQLDQLDRMKSRIAELVELVGEFSPERFDAARRRVDNAARLTEVTGLEREARRRWEMADREAAAKRAAARRARAEVDRLAAARDALNSIDELTRQLRDLELDERRKRAALTSAEIAVHAANGWWATRKARRAREEAVHDLVEFQRLAHQQRRQVTELIAQYRARAEPITRDYLTRLDADLARAQQEADRAETGLESAAATLRELRARREALRQAGLATPDDHQLVQHSEAAGLPDAFDELTRLRTRYRQAARRRGQLEEQHRRLVQRSRDLRRNAEKRIIDDARLVATTLARSRLHPALAGANFDVVLVDEAGAASLVEVMLALCRATTTAVLFGDFLQLPPVQDLKNEQGGHASLQRWVLVNPFTHIGIRTPEDAFEHSGCVVLTHQFRFGPNLRALANEVIYRVLRDAGELLAGTPRADTEIVFVDTSTLGELAVVDRGGSKHAGWWPAGLVLARALAEHHLPEDEQVGIVTPYKKQRDATLAGLRDRDLVVGVSVGTVHAFQGREFPTVVFDLVEDGRGRIASARRDGDPYADEGVRLFGVGITRAQRRLYLIGDRRAVLMARHGPLSAVRAALEQQRMRLWSGAALLGMAEQPPDFVDSVFARVSEILRQLVTVTDITDERTFYAELERELSSAQKQVWMWSPWVFKRAQQIIPLIAAAVARGVAVCVFIRPDDDRNMATPAAQAQLPALCNTGATVIRSDHEHRKIVVIDERTVLFGSLNVLSNSPHGTRESMLTLRGRRFAEDLLERLHARTLGVPHPCRRCARICQVRRSGGRKATWRWHCTGCRHREDVPGLASR